MSDKKILTIEEITTQQTALEEAVKDILKLNEERDGKSMPHLQDVQTRMRLAISGLSQHKGSGAKVPEEKPEPTANADQQAAGGDQPTPPKGGTTSKKAAANPA